LAKKSKDAFRTISEVSDALDTPAHVLRFWESKFSQIKPVKRAGGRRYYRPDDIDLLRGIKTLLHDQGMTIKGAQKLLREKGAAHIVALGGGETPPEPTGDLIEGTSSPVIEAVPTQVEDTPQLPFGVSDAAVDLPEIDVPDRLPEPGILSVLARMSASSVQAKASDVASAVARLEALQTRMLAD